MATINNVILLTSTESSIEALHDALKKGSTRAEEEIDYINAEISKWKQSRH